MKIEGRTFIVSGGSSGLGLATVKDLIQAKAYVSILDLSPLPASTFPESGQGERFVFTKTDIANVDQVKEAVDRTIAWTKETGAVLGGVINCAGLGRNELVIGPKGKSYGTAVWDLTMGVNVTGTFNLTRLALEHLVHVTPEDTPDGERGVVIMVASEAAFDGQPGQTAYAASKGAVRSMTMPMARDLARHHVRVVTIAPGPFTTPLTGQLKEKVRIAMNNSAVLYPKRYGAPEEFSTTVKWILECPYVNGETIRLTGGGRVPAFL